MKDIPKLSLLEELDATSFEHAVFLTYGIDLPFFEDSILRALIRQEAKNIAVFADGDHVASQMRHLAEMKKARVGWNHCGKVYSLTPVHHQTAFHPKVAFLVGENIQLWVGSGNLESGGVLSNLEIHNLVRARSSGDIHPDIGALIVRGWAYIRNIAEKNAAKVVLQQLDQVEESIPWVRTTAKDDSKVYRLVLGPQDNALKSLVQAVDGDKVERIIILSPFHDKDFRTLNELRRLLKPREVQVLIQPDMTSMHGPEAVNLADVEFYKLRAPKDRYAHAKIILVECKKREVILSGSHNLSERGMDGNNYEASIVRMSSDRGEMLSHLRIDQDLVEANRISKSDITKISIVARAQKTMAVGRQVIAYAEYVGDDLALRLRHIIKSKNITLLAYTDSSMPARYAGAVVVDGLNAVVKIPVETISVWTAVALEVEGETSAPVPILIVSELSHRIARNRKFRDLARKAIIVGPELGEIEGLVEDLRSVLLDEWKPQRSHKSLTSYGEEDVGASKPKQMSYEDFVIPLRHEKEKSETHSIGERATFDTVLNTILISLGGTKTPLGCGDLIEQQELDVIPDDLRTLAETNAEEEDAIEALSGDAEGESEEVNDSAKPKETVTDVLNASIADNTPEAKLKIANRYVAKFRNMAKNISGQLKKRFEGDRPISIYELEILLTAARLFTGLVERTQKFGYQKVEYLTWEEWGKAQAGLLDVLTTSRLKVLERLPWNRSGQELLRELHEGLAGWCLSIHGYANGEGIDDETRLRLRVGLRLAGQLLGVDQGKLTKKAIFKHAEWVLGHRTPDSSEPILDYDGWVREVETLRQADMKLRNIYRMAIDIENAKAGFKVAERGVWGWWPCINSHIGLIVNEGQKNVEILYEVNEKKTVLANYVVKITDSGFRGNKHENLFGQR